HRLVPLDAPDGSPDAGDRLAFRYRPCATMRPIPNALCILRMLLVVPVAWLLVTDNYRLTLAMFAFAAATDGLDGFLAKRFGWTSELGKILDPLADKILLVGVFITLAA